MQFVNAAMRLDWIRY